MADETRADSLDKSLAKAWLDWCSEQHVIPTGYVGYFEYLNEDGDRCWAIVHAENQSYTMSVGMSVTLDRTIQSTLLLAEEEEEL